MSKKINYAGGYICCQGAGLGRLDRRSKNIFNMQSEPLGVGRYTYPSLSNNTRIEIVSGLSMVKCNVAYAFEYSNKYPNDVIIFLLTEVPALGQFAKLKARGIVLKDYGLYWVYTQNGGLYVKSFEDRKKYTLSESNLVPVTDPIVPITDPEPTVTIQTPNDPIAGPDNAG